MTMTTMMMMMNRSCCCILLAFLVVCCSSLDDMLTTAAIVETTHTNRNLQITATDQQQYDMDDEEAISFDGDVSFIQQLALQKAAAMAAATGGDGNDASSNTGGTEEEEEANQYSGVYPSSCESPTNNNENTDVAVDQQELQQHHLEALTWFYSMEYKIPLDQQEQQQADVEEVLIEQQQNSNNMDSFTSVTTPTTTTAATTATSLTQLLARVEHVLQLRLANLILVCANAEAEDAAIVSEVSTPIDLASEEQTCSPENPIDNLCTDYDGKMNLFLSNGDKAEEAIYWGRKNVEEIMQDPSFIEDVGLGLVSITYLAPEPKPPKSSNDVRLGGPTSSFTNNGASTLGTASIALMAVGGAVVMVFVASVFFWRRSRYTTTMMQHSSIFVDANTATQAGGGCGEVSDGSDMIDSGVSSSVSPIAVSSNLTLSDGGGGGGGGGVVGDDGMDDEAAVDHPKSPFSEMLPSAYRFNDNMSIMSGRDGLSAVTEGPEDQSTENSTMVSDAGYTVEAAGRGDGDSSLSWEMPMSLYTGSSKETQSRISSNAGSSTAVTGVKQEEGGEQDGNDVMSPEEDRLGAHKRVDSVATEQAGNISNNSSTKATCSPCDTLHSVRSAVSDEMSDLTCSIITPAQARAASLSPSATSMLQPKNLLAQNPTAFDEGVGGDTSAADDEKMLFV